jgi:hypothetical protein
VRAFDPRADALGYNPPPLAGLQENCAAERQVIADGVERNLDKPAPKPILEPLSPALQLLPYQRRWVEDDSPLKIVVKARQIGYSFAASIHALLECLKKKTTWVFLSKGERQSRLLMEKVQEHVQSCGILARACESTFFEGTLIKQLEVRFANGSVIYGLPANPDTARGYSGNVTLDEFAFHSDADKIYTALFPTITRGYCLEVISTPNGQQGKFYEIAKAAGLVEQVEESKSRKVEEWKNSSTSQLLNPSTSLWSAHCCDIYEAIRQGLTLDLQILRAGCDDETTWQQEYCCQFISIAENFIPPALVAQCVSAEAAKDCPPQFLASAPHPGLDSRLSELRIPNSEFYLASISAATTTARCFGWMNSRCQVPGFRCQEEQSSLTPPTRHLTACPSPWRAWFAPSRTPPSRSSSHSPANCSPCPALTGVLWSAAPALTRRAWGHRWPNHWSVSSGRASSL